MNKVYTASFESKIGTIYVASTAEGVCRIVIPGQSRRDLHRWLQANLPGYEIVESPAHNSGIIDELQRYFDHRLVKFNSRVNLLGTDFQKRVWKELRKIRYGTRVSYKAVAQRMGLDGGYQAIGAANKRNPLPIVVPCHRVVGSDDRLAGYAAGPKTKEFLLLLEGETAVSRRRKA